MRLIDRVAQCKTPMVVQNSSTHVRTRLAGAAEYAQAVAQCGVRYVLSDELTRLCAALAYSKGARSLEFSDLIHVPAERVWVEWASKPWTDELRQFGFRLDDIHIESGRSRGALIAASPDGRRGTIQTFWHLDGAGTDAFASSMLAHFDLDGLPDENSDKSGRGVRVSAAETSGSDVLADCFRFQFEPSWAQYYRRANLSAHAQLAVEKYCLGTIAPDIPLLLAFFLLLATRSGLPQNEVSRTRLNRARQREGRPLLLDHIEVSAPFIPTGSAPCASDGRIHGRRERRLHAVRGHLVRRGSQVFWRIPHLRGSARRGVVRTRTVTWSFEPGGARQSETICAVEAFAS